MNRKLTVLLLLCGCMGTRIMLSAEVSALDRKTILQAIHDNKREAIDHEYEKITNDLRIKTDAMLNDDQVDKADVLQAHEKAQAELASLHQLAVDELEAAYREELARQLDF